MNERELKDIILSLPIVRGLELSANDKKKSVESIFPLALDEVTMAYDWDFTLDVATELTVASQADYVLEGNSNDCRDIINIKYDGDLMDKMGQVAYDEFMLNRTHTSIDTWIPKGRKNGFPQVTIASTPLTADVSLEYRYRRKNITLADFPDEFDYVIISAVLKHLIPSYTAQYNYDLKTMIDRHEYGGGESNQIKQDPRVVRDNNRRAKLYGYGG